MYSEAHQRAIRGHSEGPHARQRTWDSSSTTSTSCPESSPPTSRCLMRAAIRGSSVAIAVRESQPEIRQWLSRFIQRSSRFVQWSSNLCCASQRRVSIPQATGMAPSLC